MYMKNITPLLDSGVFSLLHHVIMLRLMKQLETHATSGTSTIQAYTGLKLLFLIFEIFLQFSVCIFQSYLIILYILVYTRGLPFIFRD